MNYLQKAAAEFCAAFEPEMAPLDVLRFQAIRCLKALSQGVHLGQLMDDHWGSVVSISFAHNLTTGTVTLIVADELSANYEQFSEGELLGKASESSLQAYLGDDLPEVVSKVFADVRAA